MFYAMLVFPIPTSIGILAQESAQLDVSVYHRVSMQIENKQMSSLPMLAALFAPFPSDTPSS
jgi:hypothetical protein